MTQQPTCAPYNPPPLSTLHTEPVWEGKYDEYGNRQEVEQASHEIPVQKIYDRLGITPSQLMEFCQKWQIAELAVFGSILRDDFRTGGNDPSDVDILYTYMPQVSYGFEFIDIKEELEALFARKVDFVSKNAVRNSHNWLRRREILGSGRIIYAKRSTVVA
ncbi:MAG: hypothetical protein HC918_07130 [Oscillatoriales cyanobacterium SM2_1_8]|nr:hypothetical protein [Oscillatoriales cyanobacterium SM2_1_8]